MDDPGDRIGQEARALLLSAAFRSKFAEWSARFPAFGLAGGSGALLELRRHPHPVRERVFAALVTLVREGDAEACLLLLELLRPGIAVRVGWLRDTLPADDAWQEMATEVLDAARRFDPKLCGKGIARDLLYKAWRHVAANRRRHAERGCAEVTLTEVSEEEPGGIWSDALPSVRLLMSQAEQSGVISHDEAELIVATRLHGLSLQEAASTEPYQQTAKRRRRAEARLAEFAREKYPACVQDCDDEWGL